MLLFDKFVLWNFSFAEMQELEVLLDYVAVVSLIVDFFPSFNIFSNERGSNRIHAWMTEIHREESQTREHRVMHALFIVEFNILK